MDTEHFKQYVKLIRDHQDSVLELKGHDYAGIGFVDNEDRLAQFKLIAELSGQTPFQVWAVFWLKHVSAICNYIKAGKLESDSIENRFIDEMNYALFGAALLIEGKDEGPNQAVPTPPEPGSPVAQWNKEFTLGEYKTDFGKV